MKNKSEWSDGEGWREIKIEERREKEEEQAPGQRKYSKRLNHNH